MPTDAANSGPSGVEKAWGAVKDWAQDGWSHLKEGPTLDDLNGIPDLGVVVGGVSRLVKEAQAVGEVQQVVVTGVKEASETANAVKSGEFSIWKWTGYPESIPKPNGPFRLLEGAEKVAARKAANNANKALRKSADGALDGWEVHEVQPVKFNGSPTDMANKMPLPADAHSELTTWWNGLMRDLTK